MKPQREMDNVMSSSGGMYTGYPNCSHIFRSVDPQWKQCEKCGVIKPISGHYSATITSTSIIPKTESGQKPDLRTQFDRKVVAIRGTTNMPMVVNAELERVFKWIQELHTDNVRLATLSDKALTDKDSRIKELESKLLNYEK